MQHFRFEKPLILEIPIYNRAAERSYKRVLKKHGLGFLKIPVIKGTMPYYCYLRMQFVTAGQIENVFGDVGIDYWLTSNKVTEVLCKV